MNSKSQATQTRTADSAEEDSLDTFSLLNETWVTDPDADDEAEPEKLEQAISKAEMELKELQESFSKMKCMKDSKKSKSSQLGFKERLKSSIRVRCKAKSVMHKGTQPIADSESQSVRSSVGQAMRAVRSDRKRHSQHACTSAPKYSSYADSSETEEIKRRESNIQEVIVKVESKIQDMRSVLEKLIHTKAQQKREKMEKDTRKRNEDNKEQLELKNRSDIKIKDSLRLGGKSESKKNKNETESPNRETTSRNLGRKSDSNIRKSESNIRKPHEVDIKDKTSIKDKGRPSTIKSQENREGRPKSTLSKCKRSQSGKSLSKENEKKARSHAGSSDS